MTVSGLAVAGEVVEVCPVVGEVLSEIDVDDYIVVGACGISVSAAVCKNYLVVC